MKPRYLVFNCTPDRFTELQQSLGTEVDLAYCPSREHLAELLRRNCEALVRHESTCAGDHMNGRHTAQTVTANLTPALAPRAIAPQEGVTVNGTRDKTLSDRVDLIEKTIIEETLRQHGNRRQLTATTLGISRVTLYNKMKKFGLLSDND